MAVGSGIAVTWLWLMMIGGAGAIGGAPLPLDPTLSAIAPEECLWYASFAGQGPADPKSKNHTEQLFAEPQVREFAKAIETELLKAIRRAGGPNREQLVLGEQLPKLIKAMLTRPMAICVEDVSAAEGGVAVEAAYVLNAGDQRGEIEGAMAELLKLAPPGAQLTKETAHGVAWTRVPTPPPVPAVRFGWKDEYFIVAVGEKSPHDVVARMKGGAPKWLTALRAEHPVERESSVGYLNVAGVLERLRPVFDAQEPELWAEIEKLGLTHVRALQGVSGFDADGCTSMGHIVTDGERPGLLGMLPHKPLEAADLQVIPKDSLLAVATRLDAGELWDNAIKLAADFEPRAEEEIDRALWEVENELGVNIREDIVDALGEAWVVYLPGGDLMTSWLNSAAAVRVTEADRLRGAVEKLVEVAEREFQQSNGQVAVVKSVVGGRTIYSMQILQAPVSPSLCVGDDWLVVGLLPQAVRAALDRQAEDSLAGVEVVAAALGPKEGASAIFYRDTPQLVKSVYPLAQMGLTMASTQLKQAGITLDASGMPSLEVIVKHLRPGVSTLRHGSDGFHFASKHSLPGEGNAVAAAPIAVGLLLPAVGSARGAAREAQDQNNLKQLALAMHNFHDATKSFPADLYNADGEPLLSWRVRLLPYMEEQALYNRFKLDESWDSENNRPLIEQMPQVLRSAEDPEDSTKTRFQAVSGPGTVFPGNEKLSFKHITDGTSATLAFVRVAPDLAIEWTKPGDWKFDLEKPLEGLGGPRGTFLTAYCDGSVHTLSLAIGEEVMKALATRAGDEVVQGDLHEIAPAPQFFDPDAVPGPGPAIEPVDQPQFAPPEPAADPFGEG